MNGTEKIVMITVVTAAIGAIVTAYITARMEPKVSNIPPGSDPPAKTGTVYNNASCNDALTMCPQLETFMGPGQRDSQSSFNGQIYTKRFNKGGNHNAGGNGSTENSWAFQTATKNPYANGTNCTYAAAVNSATQDPTNQATSLVLGAGLAPNNPAE